MDRKTGSELYDDIYKTMLKTVADRAGHIAGLPLEITEEIGDQPIDQPLSDNIFLINPVASNRPDTYTTHSYLSYNLSDKLDLVQEFLYARLPTVDIWELCYEINRMEDYLGLNKKKLTVNKFTRALLQPQAVFTMLNPNAPDIGLINAENLKNFSPIYISSLNTGSVDRKKIVSQLIRAYNNAMHEISVKKGIVSDVRYSNPDLCFSDICLITQKKMFIDAIANNSIPVDVNRFRHIWELMNLYCKWSFLKDLVDREREFHILAYINDTAILAIKTHKIAEFQVWPDYINNRFIDKETGKFIPGHTFEGIFKQWYGMRIGSLKSVKKSKSMEMEILL